MNKNEIEYLNDLNSLIDMQSVDGTWNYDPYQLGLLNGLILAKATLLDEEPEFHYPPQRWICQDVIQDVLNADQEQDPIASTIMH